MKTIPGPQHFQVMLRENEHAKGFGKEGPDLAIPALWLP